MNSQETDALAQLKHQLPELAVEASARAEEFEAQRFISTDFTDKLKAVGAYRILVMREQGGLGGSLLDWLDMATTLAEADASTGWACAHGAVCTALVANIADQKFVEEAFSNPEVIIAWSNLPKVTATEETGGLRVSGRWAFETGCMAANYVGGMLAYPDGNEKTSPRFVVALAPVEDARIEQTWDPVGLAGTGSHDVVFEDVFVPDHRIFQWPDSKPARALPTSVFAPGAWFISICGAATHLGLARRALDEARNELRGKCDRMSGQPLLENPATLQTLEEAEGQLYGLNAGVRQALSEIWGFGQRGEPLSVEMRMNVKLACFSAVHQGEAIVRSAYGVSGASAVRRNGVLQRLYRDAGGLIHHISTNRKVLENVGRVRLGLDPLSPTL